MGAETCFQNTASREDIEELVEIAWQRYLSARSRAEKSGDILDGIAAGHAWGEFMRLFHPVGGRLR
jgi:hypothetical protein